MRRRRQVTQRHLQGVRAIVSAAGGLACADLAAHAEGLARAFYGRLGDGQLALLRETLLRCARRGVKLPARAQGEATGGRPTGGRAPLQKVPFSRRRSPAACPRTQPADTHGRPAARARRPPLPSSPRARSFFHSRSVRVSLFLSEGIQAPDGRVVLASCLRSGGCGGEAPLGRVRMFDAAGRVTSERRHALAVLQVGGRGRWFGRAAEGASSSGGAPSSFAPCRWEGICK
jgi:hypothetical protein